MRFICEQHIFTDRLNTYATVAQSPGIDLALRKELEPWVQLAPGSDGMVCRCRPIPVEDCAWMALSFSMRRTGARGSHIAHTYLVDSKELAGAGWNLPWLALHLPFWSDYRPVPTGIVDLAPVEVNLDRAGQLRMLRWLCAISEPGVVRNWQGGLLAALAVGDPVRLDFGPTRDLAAETERLLQVPAPAGTDAVALWRAAGLLCPIPGAFQRGLSICINDDSRTDALLVIEPMGETPTRFTRTSAAGYLGHCQDLLERGQEADTELVGFLERVDGYSKTPSLRVLEATTRYLVAPRGIDGTSRMDRLYEFLSELWTETGGIPQASLEEAVGLLTEADLGSESASRLLTSTARHALSDQCYDPAIAAKMLDLLLRWRASASPAQQRTLLGGLPNRAKSLIWTMSEQRQKPPARPPTGERLEQTMLWTDALFPGFVEEQRSQAVKNVADRLVDSVWQQGASRLGSMVDSRVVVDRLIELGVQLGVSEGALWSGLLARVADIIASNDLDPAGRALVAILETPMVVDADARLDVAGRVGAALANRWWRNPAKWQQAIKYVLAPPQLERRHVEIHRRLCRAFNHTNPCEPLAPGLLKLVHVQLEFLDLLLGTCSRESLGKAAGCHRIALPAYSAWVQDPKNPPQQHSYLTFHRNLAQIVGGLETLDAFSIAVSYLCADPYDGEATRPLFWSLVRLVSNQGNGYTFSSWLRQVPPKWLVRSQFSDVGRYQVDQRDLAIQSAYAGQNPSSVAPPSGIAGVHRSASPLAMFALLSVLIERRKDLSSELRKYTQERLGLLMSWVDSSRQQDLKDCLRAARVLRAGGRL